MSKLLNFERVGQTKTDEYGQVWVLEYSTRDIPGGNPVNQPIKYRKNVKRK